MVVCRIDVVDVVAVDVDVDPDGRTMVELFCCSSIDKFVVVTVWKVPLILNLKSCYISFFYNTYYGPNK